MIALTFDPALDIDLELCLFFLKQGVVVVLLLFGGGGGG